MSLEPIDQQRNVKAVLNLLELYQGVPLSAEDITDETKLKRATVNSILARLYQSYAVQRQVRLNPRNRPVQMYFIGEPRL